MRIREIENIIDHAHEEHSVFKLSKKQATFNALATFEDVCRCILMGSIFNPFGLKEIILYLMQLLFCGIACFIMLSKGLKSIREERIVKIFSYGVCFIISFVMVLVYI